MVQERMTWLGAPPFVRDVAPMKFLFLGDAVSKVYEFMTHDELYTLYEALCPREGDQAPVFRSFVDRAFLQGINRERRLRRNARIDAEVARWEAAEEEFENRIGWGPRTRTRFGSTGAATGSAGEGHVV